MKTFEAKLSGEVGVLEKPGFPPMSSVHYLTRLQELHLRRQPQSYFEIGTESGASLGFASCASIAVDPNFRLEGDVCREKPELHLFQKTSDEFFAGGFLERFGRPIDLAFLDGLHHFEVLLRDFIGTERHMSRDGLIALHDCVPQDDLMAERRWFKRRTRMWTGDVWKLIPILRQYRPDLTVAVRDYAPTGLVEITNLDPDSTVLSDNYDQIVARFMDLSIAEFGLERFRDLLQTPSISAPARSSGDGRTIAIKVSMPDAESAHLWGDYQFALSLGAAFERLGYPARMDIMPDWAGKKEDALDVVLQGHDYFPAGPERASMLWYLYPGKRFPIAALENYEHVFVPSEVCREKLSAGAPKMDASVLPQAFDSKVMKPTARTSDARPVFVGKNHFGKIRPIISLALEAGCEFDLWGEEWEDTPAAERVRGKRVPPSELPTIYGQAAAVLSDQTAPMTRHGIVSNRIYDALAVGTPVVSTPIPGLPEKMAPYVAQVRTSEELHEALVSIAAEDEEKRAQRMSFATSLVETDSFDARARAILAKAKEKNLLT